ncbi:hypothetical protein LUZ61_009043 [Rhynchospora tenuis]|uniref:RING-type E3 ubiquitin transferase n=1 Tax=Rhynchospora tenuis TaxID=198213 RepID=A0AAD5ZWP0_9POAL|nr:hypothetical protein LUZ61_009043 [Rhynchospora tenuis]
MRHPNLVTLIGTCSENSALIYEYLPNSSLEDRLACQGGTPPLTWQVSKLSDFGISRFLTETSNNTLAYHTKYLRGTFAYMDPEFLSSGVITVKSDVYSFGIIILQLLTGKPPINIVTKVKDAIGTDSQLHLIIDKSAGEWPLYKPSNWSISDCDVLRCVGGSAPIWRAASLSVSPSYKSQLDDKGIPSYFICPIFQEAMKDPCIAADGYTYEAEAIKGWLDRGHETSPMTNLPLPHTELKPNYTLRSTIQEWLIEHP